MSKAVNNALRSLTQNYKAFGHARKGREKRLASKSRRKVDKAVCQSET